MDNLLEIRNLTVEYNNIKNSKASSITAVDDVSLNIHSGEIYALAGESGCGKSTLSKAVVKLVKPKSGEILFEGKNIYNQTKEEKRKYPANVQMVFQNPYSSLNPKMKIGDTLSEPLDINTNYSKTRKKTIIKQVLEDVGMSESCLDLYPHEFSGGQRQRIAIARSLVLNPKILVLDEPTSMLDNENRIKVMNVLKKIHSMGTTIIIVTHHINEIEYCNEVVFMDNGNIVFNGSVNEFVNILIRNEQFHKLNMPINFQLAYELYKNKKILIDKDIFNYKKVCESLWKSL